MTRSRYIERLINGYYEMTDVIAPEYVNRGLETSEKYWQYVDERLAYDAVRVERKEQYWEDIEEHFGLSNHPKIDLIRDLAQLSDGAEDHVLEKMALILETRPPEFFKKDHLL